MEETKKKEQIGVSMEESKKQIIKLIDKIVKELIQDGKRLNLSLQKLLDILNLFTYSFHKQTEKIGKPIKLKGYFVDVRAKKIIDRIEQTLKEELTLDYRRTLDTKIPGEVYSEKETDPEYH